MRKRTQKTFLGVHTFLLFCVCFFLSPLGVSASAEEGIQKTFFVTGYYSPLVGQDRYVTGSYAGDIRLNGRGTHAADGTPVYFGMLAAPRTYPFGTKISLPGMGVGTVHDRGGAIVSAGNRGFSHDRIDIWMGSGDIGMRRALQWGIRKVHGILFPKGTSSDSSFSVFGLPLAHVPQPSASKKTSPSIIQKELKKMGYFSADITGIYDSETQKSVLEFQKERNIITHKDDAGAGVFGPRTQKAFLSALQEYARDNQEYTHIAKKILPAHLSLGDKGKDVSQLRNTVFALGYAKTRGEEYDQNLADMITDFQKKNNIIAKNTDHGAGVFGPQTQKTFVEILSKRERTLHSPSQKKGKTTVFGEKEEGEVKVKDVKRIKRAKEKNTKVVVANFKKALPKNIDSPVVASTPSERKKSIRTASFGKK